MEKYKNYIFIGISIVLLILFGIMILNISVKKTENKYLEKEIVSKLRIDSLEKAISLKQLSIDSLSKQIVIKEKITEKKINNLVYIKPKYDKKINYITSFSADTVSKFITDRYPH